MRERAWRRQQAGKAKAAAKRKLQIDNVSDLTARRIGMCATQHNTCDCWMCKLKERDERKQFQPKLHD